MYSALYMGKPTLMVPTHVEQECNAADAEREGVGIVDQTFSLDRLIDFTHQYMEDGEFRLWENQAEQKIIAVLENIYEDYSLRKATLPTEALTLDVACS